MVKAYQTSPLLTPTGPRCAASTRACRRPAPAGGRRSAPASAPRTSTDLRGLPGGPAQQRPGRSSRRASLLFDNGATKAAIESARNQIAAGRADLKDVEQLVLFNAVQAYVDVRRDEEFVRLASNDVDRLNETMRATQQPLRRRRGHPHRRQPERVAPRRLALQLETPRAPLEVSRAVLPPGGRHASRAEPRAAAAAAAAAEVRRRVDRDRHAAQPADHLGAVRRARRRLRLRPGPAAKGPSLSARRRAGPSATTRSAGTAARFGLSATSPARCRSTPAAATTA